MKEHYTVEMYHTKREEVRRVSLEASPLEIERIAVQLLSRNAKYDGVRFLREVMKPQVVELANYHREGGMVRAVSMREVAGQKVC